MARVISLRAKHKTSDLKHKSDSLFVSQANLCRRFCFLFFVVVVFLFFCFLFFEGREEEKYREGRNEKGVPGSRRNVHSCIPTYSKLNSGDLYSDLLQT